MSFLRSFGVTLAGALVAVALAVTPAAAAHDCCDGPTHAVTIAESAAADRQSAAQQATDYDSWAAVTDAINQELAAGEQSYADGDHAAAASHFSKAMHTGYVASNFAKIVADKSGNDAYTEQLAQLRELGRLVYADGNTARINEIVQQLTAQLTAAAQQFDADSAFANPRDYAAARAERTQQEREQLDAAKVHVNEGRGERSWTQVADEMDAVLTDAVEQAEAGDGKAGADSVNNAYYQYYEKLGFEKNVMNAIGGSRVSKVESTFKETRKAMVAGDAARAATLVDELKGMLAEDAVALDGGASGNVNGFTALVTSAAGQSFLVLIREGLEALLVVAAVIAYLLRSGLKKYVGWVYVGAIVGLAASGGVAAVFMSFFGGSGPQQEIMEGVCALIAAVMLVWSGNWMLSKRSVDSWNTYIRTKTEAAVGTAKSTLGADTAQRRAVLSLALLSFLAVFREGAETIIFYESIYSMTTDARGMWIGAGLAALVLAIVFAVIRLTSVHIPLGAFFMVTSVLMSALAVVFVGGGVHSLIEGDLIAATYIESLPTNEWLGFYPYLQTVVAQIIAALLVIGMFTVLPWLKRRHIADDDADTTAGKSAGAPDTTHTSLDDSEHQPVALPVAE